MNRPSKLHGLFKNIVERSSHRLNIGSAPTITVLCRFRFVTLWWTLWLFSYNPNVSHREMWRVANSKHNLGCFLLKMASPTRVERALFDWRSNVLTVRRWGREKDQPEVRLELTRPPKYKYGALPIKLLRHSKNYCLFLLLFDLCRVEKICAKSFPYLDIVSCNYLL